MVEENISIDLVQNEFDADDCVFSDEKLPARFFKEREYYKGICGMKYYIVFEKYNDYVIQYIDLILKISNFIFDRLKWWNVEVTSDLLNQALSDLLSGTCASLQPIYEESKKFGINPQAVALYLFNRMKRSDFSIPLTILAGESLFQIGYLCDYEVECLNTERTPENVKKEYQRIISLGVDDPTLDCSDEATKTKKGE